MITKLKTVVSFFASDESELMRLISITPALQGLKMKREGRMIATFPTETQEGWLFGIGITSETTWRKRK